MILVSFFFLMIRQPPRSTRTDTLFPYTTLFRSLRARKFFRVERDVAVGIEDGDGRSGKAAVLDRHVGALLADQRQRVERLAADPFHRRDGIAAYALVRLRVQRVERVVAHPMPIGLIPAFASSAPTWAV